METLILHNTTKDKIKSIKNFLKTLDVDFSFLNIKSPTLYNAEFINKIKQSELEIKEGKTKQVKKEDFKDFLGL